jgi:TolB protein
MTLYDINLNNQVLTKALSISKKDRYPFVGHSIAIIVNKYLKAPSIEWMGEFVVFAKSIGKHRSQIVISDYSLKYQNVIISNGLNVFPKWASSKKDSFYYTSYNEDKPTLYKINIFTGKREKILSSDGMLVCSDVSKDGTKLLLTLAPNDQPDIYLYDIKTKIKKRVTRYNGIDVNGNFVEDDKKVVFISDRLRRPNIFIKSINSRAVKRLVYHGSNNSSCSTFDDYVVYSSKEDTKEFGKRNFNLYLVSTQTDTIQKLTTNGVNQFPKFSFDGESVLFIKNYQDKSYVGIVRLNYNKSFLFPIKVGKLQSIDW